MTKEEKFIKAVCTALQNECTSWVDMGVADDGSTICVVAGWELGFDKEDDLYQLKDGDKYWTLCMKIAYNTDDLQCDYDFDWEMPFNSNGDVYDTNSAVDANDTWMFNFKWWEQEANKVIGKINSGELRTK